ncbi:MAG: methyl-accepting chemotaxis protein [Nitrospinae bacterium]|nr:methyl-accepting chemotaxis protein [Nitrospinota bacterium]
MTIQVKIFLILLAFLVAQASFQLYQNVRQADTAMTELAAVLEGQSSTGTPEQIAADKQRKNNELERLKQESSNTRNLAIGAAVVLIAINLIVLNMFFRFTVVTPVNQISEAADRIANGDLTSQIDTTRQDEIGGLSQALFKMQENLKEMIHKINGSSSDVTRSAEELSVLARHIAEGSEKQNEQSTHVAASVEEMSSTIMEIAKNSNQALESSNAAKEAALAGSKVVQETIAGIHRISSSMEQSSKVIQALGNNSDQISEIVSVIDDIADQTNLLALNAAIEAARAGEAGRGFAVVADEVRKLAERTTKATKEIATMISKIQADTQDAVMSMETVMDEVKSGVRSADETGQSLKSIVEQVQNSADMVSHIATASEQQSKTVEEISKNMHSVAEISKSTSQDTQRTYDSAQNLTQLAGDLKKLVDQFKT